MSTPIDEERIFHIARGIADSGLREEYLGQVCSGDAQLRERIEQLLQACEQDDGPLGTEHELPETGGFEATGSIGQTIGPFKLLQQIGEGGMGTVYMAEQTRPISRRVAVKIIKPGMDSKAVIARFEAERQALALMDHPNIAKVLDAGTTDDRHPYFVMELVKGVPITEYCDEHKLPIRERLELFIQVCQAVQHAHQKGIIHRDIKPSNVLVAKYDDKPVPKVIDFGVAKAISQRLTERTMFTQYGQIVGTLEYMSPEQAQFNQLDVDTRSDIYSLGVLLYELLTGETPFDGKRLRSSAFEEVLRILREEEPPRPSQMIGSLGENVAGASVARGIEPNKLRTFLRGDLDWIVMKALEKNRQRRYESPLRLSDDLAEYLAGRTIDARPPTLKYKLETVLRRHRVELGVATIILALIVIGVSGTAWQASKNRQTRRQLEAQKSVLLKNAMEQTTMLILQGNVAGARDKFSTACELGADSAWCEMRLGLIALQEGDHPNAKLHFDEAKSELPDSTAAHALSLIGEYFAGHEHDYMLRVGGLKDWKPVNTDDYLFRGFAQTWANPRRAVQDLEVAISRNPQNVMAHLLYARALRLQAADTPILEQAYVLSKKAVEEALAAKKLLPRNPLALHEHIHANIVLANTCERLGDGYSFESDQARDAAKRIVTESRELPYNVITHQARVCFYNQLGTVEQEKSELFDVTLPSEVSEEYHGIVWRRAWVLLRENKHERARSELSRLQKTALGQFHSLTPAIVDLWQATDGDLNSLQEEFATLLSRPDRDRQGIYAHHDIAVARLLGMEQEVVLRRARKMEDLGKSLGHDFTENFVPLARYMRGDEIDPESGLRGNADSNRLRAETYFLLAADEIARGNRSKAREYFQRCIDTGYYEYIVYWWSSLLIDKLDDDNWLPWLNSKAE